MNIKGLSQIGTIILTGKQRVKFDIPAAWSINKLKCLLVSQVQNLKFNCFELMHNGKLVRGDTKIGSVCSVEERELELVVINAKSLISFEEYYGRTMGRFLEIAYNGHLPVLSADYQQTVNLIENKNQKSLDQKADAAVHEQIWIQPDPEARQFPLALKVLRILGLSYFLYFSISKGKNHQTSMIIFTILSHYVIQMYKGYYGKKARQENKQNESQVKIQNSQENEVKISKFGRMKGQFYFRYYRWLQIMVCYVLSLFPNWDIQIHHEIHDVQMAECRQKVNRYRPGTYQKKEQKVG